MDANAIAAQLHSLGIREQAALRNPNAEIGMRQLAAIAERRCSLLRAVVEERGAGLGLDTPTIGLVIEPKD